jgi:hypothetical protein
MTWFPVCLGLGGAFICVYIRVMRATRLVGVCDGLHTLSLVSVVCMAAACMYSMYSFVFVPRLVVWQTPVAWQPFEAVGRAGVRLVWQKGELADFGSASPGRELCGLWALCCDATRICMHMARVLRPG